MPVARGFETAVLVDSGLVTLDGTDVARAELAVVPARDHDGSVLLAAGPEGARVLVLGGEPRRRGGRHVVELHRPQPRGGPRGAGGLGGRGRLGAGEPGRFGRVEGYEGEVERIPAPALPGVRLKPRGNREGRSGFAGAEAPPMS